MKLKAEEQFEIQEKLCETGLLVNYLNEGLPSFDLVTIDKLIKDKNIDVQIYGYRQGGKSNYRVTLFKAGVHQLACQESDSLFDAFMLCLGEAFDVLPLRLRPKGVTIEVFPSEVGPLPKEVREVLEGETEGYYKEGVSRALGALEKVE